MDEVDELNALQPLEPMASLGSGGGEGEGGGEGGGIGREYGDGTAVGDNLARGTLVSVPSLTAAAAETCYTPDHEAFSPAAIGYAGRLGSSHEVGDRCSQRLLYGSDRTLDSL